MTPFMPLGLLMALLCSGAAPSDRRLWPAAQSPNTETALNAPCAIEVSRRAAGPTSGAAAAMPHIRTDDVVVRWLLDTGASTSMTFRSLMRDIERSDLVVHLRIVPMPNAMAGRTAFATSAGGVRYVQVLLQEPQKGTEALVILAHELQHVLEVARNPLIVDARSMATQYVHHGTVRKRGTAILVDTVEAVLVGDAVAQQLRGRRWELDQDFAHVRTAAHQPAGKRPAWQLPP